MKRKIAYELREVQQLLHRKIESDKSKRDSELTHIQVRVLLIIHNSEQDIFQKDVEKHLRIRRSTATEILKLLERDGFIERVRLETDGRMKKIVTTPKTTALIDKMKIHVEETELMLRSGIKSHELDVFFKVLDQIKENIK